MPSFGSWQQQIAESRGKCRYSVKDLKIAEKSAYIAYDARIREMAKHGAGVAAHDGKSAQMVISLALSILSQGEEKRFQEIITEYSEKAANDPFHYSAIAHGLISAERYLKQKIR